MFEYGIVRLEEDPPVLLESLKIVKHYFERIEETKRTKDIRISLSYTYYWNQSTSAGRIYRKSPVAPWLEKYLRYDDAEYLDILRYNGLLEGPLWQDETNRFLSHHFFTNSSKNSCKPK